MQPLRADSGKLELRLQHLPLELPTRLQPHRAILPAGFDILPTGLGAASRKENGHVHSHGASGQTLPGSLLGLPNGSCPEDSPSSLHHLLHAERNSSEEGSLHGLLNED